MSRKNIRSRLLKIYQVQINTGRVHWRFWYYHHKGEKFYAVLVSKRTSENIVRPVFAIVDQEGECFQLPPVVKTIRPEDCKIIDERFDDEGNCQHYHLSFSN